MNKEIDKREKEINEIPYTKKDREILKSILRRYPYPAKQLNSKEKK